ncbi:MAG: hypothetical protein N2Z85_01300 [Patescibacteria group bacterium]|nr:hypothetical protein [Patescibacteria group bacterium]
MNQSSKRILSAGLSLLFLFLALLIFIYFVKPAYNETQSLRLEALKKTDFINNQKALIDQFQKINQDYLNQIQSQEIFSLMLPPSPSVAEALIQISGLLKNNNLKFLSANVGRPLILSANQTSSDSSIKPIGTFDVNIKISGDYINFKNFLEQLETNIRLSNIKTINLSQISVSDQNMKNQQKSLIYDLSIGFYYQSQ